MILVDAPAPVAFAVVLGAAAIDVTRFEIPDSASIAVVTLAAAFGLLHPGFAWWSHLAAPGLMFGFGLLAFSRGWLGGGDVKLMTAVAAWTGLAGLPLMFVATSIAGGVLALVLMLVRRSAGLAGGGNARLLHRDAPLPYAVAIAAGTGWWLWATGGGPLAG